MSEESPQQARRYGTTTDRSGYGNDLAAGPVLQYGLDETVQSLRGRPQYQNGDQTGATLLKEPDLRVVLIALKAGAGIREHDASGPISVQTLSGRVVVEIGGDRRELGAGQLLMLEPGIEHSLEALDESAILLTIGRTRYEVESKAG